MVAHRIPRFHLITLTLLALSLVGALAPRGLARAAVERYVIAAATCFRTIDTDSHFPTVEVTLENQSGLMLHVAYAQSFGSEPIREDGPTGLKLARPALGDVIEIADGATATFSAGWAGGQLMRSHVIVALVVTSAGVFLPACDLGPEKMTYKNKVPTGEAREIAESAAIATEAIGQLESWLAYPALYALLHPDARKTISYEAMACWYARQFGPPITSDTQFIFSTEATDVKQEAWTWGVTGKEYARSVLVTYEQAIGRSENATPEESSMHLVRAGGLWRWFLGGSADAVAALPTDCGLPEFL